MGAAPSTLSQDSGAVYEQHSVARTAPATGSTHLGVLRGRCAALVAHRVPSRDVRLPRIGVRARPVRAWLPHLPGQEDGHLVREYSALPAAHAKGTVHPAGRRSVRVGLHHRCAPLPAGLLSLGESLLLDTRMA